MKMRKSWLGMGLAFTTLMTACSPGNSAEALSTGGKTVVTLSVQQDSEFYRAVEQKFEQAYPEIDLQVQAYKGIGETMKGPDYENYQKSASTALLSGKGADIYETSSLPVSEYVNKQLFLNMEDYLKQSQTLKRDDLAMNVLNALKLDGGTYIIPSGYYLRAFLGDGDVLKQADVDDKSWTWQDFNEIAKSLIEAGQKAGSSHRYALPNNPPDLLLQEMVFDSYNQFVDAAARKAKFDSPAFIYMMRQIQEMYDDNVMTSKPAEVENQLFYSTVIQTPADFINIPYTYFANPKLLYKPHSGNSGAMRIIPISAFAIQAKSPVTDQAWRFIEFLLSEEAQSIQSREGFSLLQSLNHKQLGELQQQVKSGTYKLPSGKLASVPDGQFKEFQEMMDTADNFAMMDVKIINIIGEEAGAFFSGQKTAEEVAKLIQNKATTYLNE
ncbi:extracellular solute-binding protein [Paenibacillus tritici]|uniref:ABC transporter substrate-binding protein n=1 Tax=Paenibacillus tritici TaxID=1873425 RepID=UPI001BA8960A|nr:extracellular solute-binding protein [Paenibacillus tritici]QUL54877.1 extracellular solute-binding protein [Paenibacillus tritici]